MILHRGSEKTILPFVIRKGVFFGVIGMNSLKGITKRICFNRRSFISLTFSSATVLFCGCSLTGKKRDKAQESVTPTDDYGLRQTTKKLIVKIDNMEYLREDKKENPESTICFLGITDPSGNQIPEINEAVRAQFRESTSYRLITEDEIERAVKKAEIKRNDIYIPEERKKFTSALGSSYRYLLSGQVISVPKEPSEPGKPFGDQIIFDLVNPKDDEQVIIQDRLASFYTENPRNKVMGLF